MIWTIALLVLLNIVLMAALWYQRRVPPPQPPGQANQRQESVTQFLNRELQLTGDQKTVFERLRMDMLKHQHSNDAIDEMYDAALRAGARGGKIAGAGGGGFLLLYAPYERHGAIREALAGLQELPFRLVKGMARRLFLITAGNIAVLRKGCAVKQISMYISTLQKTLNKLPVERIAVVVDILREAHSNGRQVFIMGNGGSASTATHFVCDLAKNTRREGMPHFRVIGLTDNMAIFSA